MLVHYSPSSPIFFPLPFSMVADGCPTAPNFTCSRHGESCFLLISESRIWFAQLGAGGYSWIISHNWVEWERTGSPNVKLATGGPAPRIRRGQVQMKKENHDLNRHSKMFLLYSIPLLLNISVYFMLPLEIHVIHEKPWSQGSYRILLNSVFSAFTGSRNSFGNMAIKTPWNIVWKMLLWGIAFILLILRKRIFILYFTLHFRNLKVYETAWKKLETVGKKENKWKLNNSHPFP